VGDLETPNRVIVIVSHAGMAADAERATVVPTR
jgi:hypothetical protein